jgi:hypothetical protein
MPGFRILSALPLGAATAALLAIGLSRGRWEDAYQFALPGLAVTFLIWMAVFRSGAGTAESRKLVAALSWFGLGVLLPIGVFAIPYLASDSLGDLYRGLFVVPRRRFEFSASLPQSPLGAGPVLAAAALLLAGRWIPRRFLRAYWLGVVVVLGAAMVLSGRDRRVHDFLWDSVAQALPLATLALTAMIARASRSDNGASAQTSRWVFIAITTTFCALIQYPFAIPVYFCYVVPLVWVLLIPLGQRLAEGNRPALIAFGGAYLVFGALFLEPFRLEGLSGPFDPVPLARLDSGRGGLLIGSEQARLFAETLAAVQSHAGTGVIYAGPDAPEIYFLTGLRNPTPALFDFAVPDSLFRRKLMAEIESNRISAVVIKRPTTGTILHSAFLEPEVFQALERRFPRYQDIDGRFTRFTIRWSDQPAVR